MRISEQVRPPHLRVAPRLKGNLKKHTSRHSKTVQKN